MESWTRVRVTNSRPMRGIRPSGRRRRWKISGSPPTAIRASPRNYSTLPAKTREALHARNNDALFLRFPTVERQGKFAVEESWICRGEHHRRKNRYLQLRRRDIQRRRKLQRRRVGRLRGHRTEVKFRRPIVVVA